MSKRSIRLLWILTAAAAAMLAAATFLVSQEAREKEEEGYVAYVVGTDSVIYLRENPSALAHIVTILELDQQVFVTGRTVATDDPWLQVDTGEYQGWVPAERIGRQPRPPDQAAGSS